MGGIRVIIAIVAGIALLAGACGSDSPANEATQPDAATTESQAPEEPDAAEGAGADDADAPEEDAEAAEEDADASEEDAEAAEEQDAGVGGAAAETQAADEDLEDATLAVFDDSTTVDNRYFPLVPGTRHVYEGTALEDDEVIERKVITIVTDLTKEIGGVDTVVVWERDFNDDVLAESEISFFAQDNDGNLWYFGEYTEVYDEDELVGGRIWALDLPEGAKAGLYMPADPATAKPNYSQGYAPPPFYWTDRATVAETEGEICIDEVCYKEVLITEESDADNPGVFQQKYYAPGVGNVRIGFRGPDPEEEEMVLVEDVVLTGDELAEARGSVLELEARGYLYAQTAPAQPRS